MICVYALTGRRAGRIAARGLAREPLRAITTGAVTAIVGELRRAPAPSESTLRRYDAVIRGLAGRLPAVLPARFGTCVADPEELRLILRSRQQALRQALARVRGRAQMTVRVVSPAISAGPAEAGRHAPDGISRASGSAYLKDRADIAARAREIPGFDPVRAAVRRWVRDERVEKRSGIASVYHLVPRGSAAAYRHALERAAKEAALEIVVSGPWPAYAFTEVFDRG